MKRAWIVGIGLVAGCGKAGPELGAAQNVRATVDGTNFQLDVPAKLIGPDSSPERVRWALESDEAAGWLVVARGRERVTAEDVRSFAEITAGKDKVHSVKTQELDTGYTVSYQIRGRNSVQIAGQVWRGDDILECDARVGSGDKAVDVKRAAAILTKSCASLRIVD